MMLQWHLKVDMNKDRPAAKPHSLQICGQIPQASCHMRGYKAVTYPGHSDLVAETLCFPNINLLVLFLLTAE